MENITQQILETELKKERAHVQYIERQKTIKYLNELQMYINHELNELKLCLTGEPHIPFARQRVTNIQDKIDKIVTNWGVS